MKTLKLFRIIKYFIFNHNGIFLSKEQFNNLEKIYHENEYIDEDIKNLDLNSKNILNMYESGKISHTEYIDANIKTD